MQKSFVPELFLRPKPANQSAPRLQISGATATCGTAQSGSAASFYAVCCLTVSTFATVVGQPNTPTAAGNGGLRRGFPETEATSDARSVATDSKDLAFPPMIQSILFPHHRCMRLRLVEQKDSRLVVDQFICNARECGSAARTTVQVHVEVVS